MELPNLDFMIVSNDLFHIENVRRILSRLGILESSIHAYEDPNDALTFLSKNELRAKAKVIALVDITMTPWTGWEFLDRAFQQKPNVGKDYLFHMLSTSVDRKEMERANADKRVEYYMVKALTRESIRLIIHVLSKRNKIA